MGYSFTEKKRLRKSFSKRPEGVLPIPYLLQTQLESYRKFLQADATPDGPPTTSARSACACMIRPRRTGRRTSSA